jgi:hypothetical protein
MQSLEDRGFQVLIAARDAVGANEDALRGAALGVVGTLAAVTLGGYAYREWRERKDLADERARLERVFAHPNATPASAAVKEKLGLIRSISELAQKRGAEYEVHGGRRGKRSKFVQRNDPTTNALISIDGRADVSIVRDPFTGVYEAAFYRSNDDKEGVFHRHSTLDDALDEVERFRVRGYDAIA